VTWAWGLFGLYAVATALLAWRGSKDAGTASGFALGSGTLSPWVAGITLGACLASSATFVIVPGFVHAEGLPALIGFTLPFVGGIAAGLILLSGPFQRVGKRVRALTVPHWLGARYESPRLRQLFAGLNVLNLAYLVLIVVGCSYVMNAALGVPYRAAVIGITAFVFGYTAFGGATAHAFTNTLQGAVMLGVALLIAGSTAKHWPETAQSLLGSGWTAPDSVLFSSWWEVWIIPAIMGFALTTQPHLLSKALYVADRRALRKTVAIALVCFLVFNGVLLAGAASRVVLPAGLAQDQVMAQYLIQAFEWAPLSAFVTVAILAASMSTLDGLLVAMAASVGGDLFPKRASARLNRLVLAGLAVATVAIAWSPPELVLLLGQVGVYGLVAASAGPLLAGLFRQGPLQAWPAFVSAIGALVVHFGSGLFIDNPGVTAALGLAVGVPVALLGPAKHAATVPDALAAK
jgi:SSS family solute:Na+ symporter/sodium/pantothenate symporter